MIKLEDSNSCFDDILLVLRKAQRLMIWLASKPAFNDSANNVPLSDEMKYLLKLAISLAKRKRSSIKCHPVKPEYDFQQHFVRA